MNTFFFGGLKIGPIVEESYPSHIRERNPPALSKIQKNWISRVDLAAKHSAGWLVFPLFSPFIRGSVGV